MSRTYKTRPLSVRIADRTDNHVDHREHHDHTSGACSLPATIKEQNKLSDKEIQNLSCYYDFKYNGHQICGCSMCTNKIERTAARKKQRYNKNQTIQEQI